jgi:hypothetical protein
MKTISSIPAPFLVPLWCEMREGFFIFVKSETTKAKA